MLSRIETQTDLLTRGGPWVSSSDLEMVHIFGKPFENDWTRNFFPQNGRQEPVKSGFTDFEIP